MVFNRIFYNDIFKQLADIFNISFSTLDFSNYQQFQKKF